jgi:glycosyltransferase involved in cell wall biosynthesis
MKVLHLIKTSEGGGWARRQVEQLVRLGEEVHVGLPGPGVQVELYEAAGARVHFVPVDFRFGMLPRLAMQVSSLRKLFDEVKPDVVHSHTLASTLIMRLALKNEGVPLLFQVPGPLHLEHQLYRNFELNLAGPNDSWIGTCIWTRDKYVSLGCDPSRVFLSYYGLNLTDELPPKGKLRGLLGLDAETPLVGMVCYTYAIKRWLGQTRGIKGHEDFIEGIALAKKRVPNIRGVIIGGPWLRAEGYFQRLQDMAKRLAGDSITFLGTRSDVHELYPDLDAVVHPSLSENVGGVAESLMHHTPTIATNIGGMPDFLHNGESGWLVPPRSPYSIAEAVVDAICDRDKALAMGEAGNRLVRSGLDVTLTGREILEIHQKVKSR